MSTTGPTEPDELHEPQEKTRRFTLRLPIATSDELELYAARSGTTRTQFLSVAMVLGARALDRALTPLPPNVMAQLAHNMATELSSPAVLDAMTQHIKSQGDLPSPK